MPIQILHFTKAVNAETINTLLRTPMLMLVVSCTQCVATAGIVAMVNHFQSLGINYLLRVNVSCAKKI